MDTQQIENITLIQPGPFGDLFVCAPIAKYLSEKFSCKIYWPAREKFIPTLKYFIDYVQPVVIPDTNDHSDWLRSDVMYIYKHIKELVPNAKVIIDLADRGNHTQQSPNENFEQYKYRASRVPFEEKNRLNFRRNTDKEKELEDIILSHKEFALVHNIDSYSSRAALPNIELPIIQIREIPGFNIPDWYSVITKAKQIYCVESSVHQFIDGLIGSGSITQDRYLLRRPIVKEGIRLTMSPYWKLDYIGKDSIVQG